MLKKQVDLYLDITETRISCIMKFSNNAIKSGIIFLPKGVILDGKIKDLKTLSSSISKFIFKQRIKVATISYVLNISTTFTRKLIIYEDENLSFEDQVYDEIKMYIKGDISNYKIQYKRLKKIGTSEHLIFVSGVELSKLNLYYKLTEDLGYQPGKITIKDDAICVFDSVYQQREKDTKTEHLYINIEDTQTQFVIVSNGEFQYSKIEAFGIQDLRDKLNIKGTIDANKLAAADNLMLTGIVEKWVNVTQTIQKYYESRQRGKQIKKIFLCGPGALIYNVLEKFEANLTCDVEVLNTKITTKGDACYVGSLGIMALENSKISDNLNFFEGFKLVSLRQKIDIKFTTRQSILAVVVALLFIAGISVHFYVKIQIKNLDQEIEHVQALNSEKRLNDAVKESNELNKQIKDYQEIQAIGDKFREEYKKEDLLSSKDIQDILGKTPEKVYISSINYNRDMLSLECIGLTKRNALKHLNNLRGIKIDGLALDLDLGTILQTTTTKCSYVINISIAQILEEESVEKTK